ncbi:ribonuclease HII [Candidatus Photodesmus blepharus]|uniref:Ribonuclease HII n=1 Tax=Candidatus Photodesmus blepharonis TaxID=1179155 RepID=A0A084CNY8_9GAMM|nr:ribonuclease HII [Candidatus Photodesmus blepharus]KEY91517.1 ribonuclease HII [Candidatus Photodesmus blepharus]
MATRKETAIFPPFIYPEGYRFIAGVDEVGCGSLVGDVVAAAIVLDSNNSIEGLNDSKRLSNKKRLMLFREIQRKSLAWAIGRSSPREIDELNIFRATMIAMQRAVFALSVRPDLVLIDGNKGPKLSMDSISVVKGDSKILEVSAASIVAKVTRDQDMQELDKLYPEFGFAKHKGYPTKAHLAVLKEKGVIDQYRKKFKPVRTRLSLE